MVIKSNDPLSRVMARVEIRIWLKRHTISDEVERVARRIVETADTMSKGIDTPDHNRLIADVVSCDLYEAIELYTGINNPSDPVCVICVEAALEKYGLILDAQD